MSEDVTGLTETNPFESAEVLDLEPGDTLVFRVQGFLTRDDFERLMTHYQLLFPENKILVLDQRTTVEVRKS